MQRIEGELKALATRADFPLELLPLAKVTTPEQAAAVQQGTFDVVLLYAASNAALFKACSAADPRRDTIVFVRHKSGPTYYGYECLGVRHFQVPFAEWASQNNADQHGGVTLDDVVVDDYDEVLWRLRGAVRAEQLPRPDVSWRWAGRAASGTPRHPTWRGSATTSISSKSPTRTWRRGWQPWRGRQPAAATMRRLDRAVPESARHETGNRPGLRAARVRALRSCSGNGCSEHQAPAITINQCMGTILAASNTTACMPLSWLNDEGFLAFCESDFVVVPPGILLHYISGKPVVMHNSTFPHKGMVTCAHCTAPRRMNGKRYEPVRIMTHYESDFGAAPKVDMPVGQLLSAISPEYTTGPVGRHPRHRARQPVLRHLPHPAGCGDPGRLAPPDSRGPRLTLDDGLRRLSARDRLRRAQDRPDVG